MDSAATFLVRTPVVLLLAALTISCSRLEASRPAVEVDMANVDLHVAADVTLHIRQLRGRFVGVDGGVPFLDDKQSYAVAVERGEIAIDLASLNALMTRSMGGGRSNVKRLKVSLEGDTLRQQGVIDSAIDVPFTASSVVSATPDGRIRVSTRSVRGFGIPIRGMMKLFRLEMDDLVQVAAGSGVETDGNDMIIDPAVIIPAPAIRGRITGVRIEGQRMVQTFGRGRVRPTTSRALAPNHIYWRGSELAFGKLRMVDTDLELIDMDPNDAFDFSVDRWNAQLVAGYSKTLANRGLQAFLPDYDDLASSRRTTRR